MKLKCIVLFFILHFFILHSSFSQYEITNPFLSYFDVAGIENNQSRPQLIVSTTADEYGFNCEKFSIKKNIFSWSYSFSAKRLLPNIGGIWTPQTQTWMMVFPTNGLMAGAKVRWYFNNRKFAFAGVKVFSGYLWTQNQIMSKEIGLAQGPSLTIYRVDWVNNFRIGGDLTVGRKYINKFLSEISIELGYRMDYSNSQYECLAYCYLGGNPAMKMEHKATFMAHFQVIFGFDLN